MHEMDYKVQGVSGEFELQIRPGDGECDPTELKWLREEATLG
jgi:hypothetical protein